MVVAPGRRPICRSASYARCSHSRSRSQPCDTVVRSHTLRRLALVWGNDAAPTITGSNHPSAMAVALVTLRLGAAAGSRSETRRSPVARLLRACRTATHGSLRDCAHAMRDPVEASGATFRGFPPVADFDLRNVATEFPGFADVPSGPDRNLFIVKRAFVDTIPAQHEAIQEVLQDFPADVILAESFLFGALPMLLGPRSERPPIVMLGTMPLHLRRDDGAPPFAGMPPATNDAERERNEATHQAHDAAFLGPINVDLQSCLRSMGIDPPAMTMFATTVLLRRRLPAADCSQFRVPPRTHALVRTVCGHSSDPGEPGATATLGRRTRWLSQGGAGYSGHLVESRLLRTRHTSIGRSRRGARSAGRGHRGRAPQCEHPGPHPRKRTPGRLPTA